jgi:hypothetical protein
MDHSAMSTQSDCKFCRTTPNAGEPSSCQTLEQAYEQTPERPYGCPWFDQEDRKRNPKSAVPEPVRDAQTVPESGEAKPFGHFYWKSNGDGTDSPDFCQGEVPSHVRVARGLTPLYTAPPAVSCVAREVLEEADGCFEAALAEGWLDALASGNIDAIRDIWNRRISYARHPIVAALSLPAAGGEASKREAEIVERCMKVIDDMRVSDAGNFSDPKYAGQRGKDRSDALYDVYHAIRASLRKDG